MLARTLRLFTVAPKVSAMLLHTNARVMCPIVIKMPSLSPTMDEGEITKWYKQEGKEICSGDLLCQVKTDKAEIDVDTEDEGILAKIIRPEHSKNAINSPIGLIATEDEDWEDIRKNWEAYVPKLD
nr:pyruvate dehydrogenase protein X component [Hymenolepis microstoma]